MRWMRREKCCPGKKFFLIDEKLVEVSGPGRPLLGTQALYGVGQGRGD